jgi:transglutaminase-like putative cysteine protease
MNRWLVVVSVLSVGCGSTLSPEILKAAPSAKEFRDADYVVMLDESVVTYEPGKDNGPPQRVETARWRIKLLKPTALPPIKVGYSRTFTRVESIRAWNFDEKGEGKELDTKTKRADRTSFENSVLVSDWRVVSVPVPPLPVGSIFESEVITRDLDARPHVTSFTFGDSMPVQTARLVVRLPKDWELRWITLNGEVKPTQSSAGEMQEFTFESTKLPGDNRRSTYLAPPVELSRLMVNARLEKWREGKEEKTAFANPEALSQWLSGEYEKQSVVTPDLEKQVRDVLAKVGDAPEDKARALYEFACQSVQYCAIEIGYGGWVPHSAESVRSVRYGDCKDKANYLHTLLKVAGLSSAPTLIYAHRGSPRQFGLPSLGTNFNHAILAVDLPGGRTVYADPTHRTVPFGQLPPGDQDAPVLELRPTGAALKKTPVSEASVNIEQQRLDLDLRANGDASGTVTLIASGAHAVWVTDQLVDRSSSADAMLNKRMWMHAARVTSAKATRTGDFVDTVQLEGQLSVPHVVLRGSTGDALLRVGGLFDAWVQYADKKRSEPLVWPVAETLRSTVSLHLPQGATIGALPVSESIESKLGKYSLNWSRTGDTVIIERELVRSQRVVQPSDFAELNRFITDIRNAEHRAAVLKFPEVQR